MTRQETSRLKNAMQNHDYVARKQLTEWESINRKINNREDFEKFIEIYSLYLDSKQKMASLWINKNELNEFQQMIS
jgi:hypothetical protein